MGSQRIRKTCIPAGRSGRGRGLADNDDVIESRAIPSKMEPVPDTTPKHAWQGARRQALIIMMTLSDTEQYRASPAPRLLLVEDEARIAEFVISGLQNAGFEIRHAKDGATGLAEILNGEHDLVILDVMLPVLNGFEVLAKVREMGNPIPVIFLSARSELTDRLQGFDIGADDYVPKPFFVEELTARIRAVLARKSGNVLDEIVAGELTLNKVSHQATWRGNVAQLSQREFHLVECLIRSPNRIFSRQQLLKHVWGISFNPETNVVDVCIQRIRKKLNYQARDGRLFPIATIRGVGYRFRLEGCA